MLRISFVLSVVLILALAGPSVADSPFNVDFFCGWGGCYRPMQWTPVEIEVSSTLTEPFQGAVTVSAQQDGLNTLNIVHTFPLTPDLPSHLPLVTKLAFGAEKCSVSVTDERGRVQWRQDYDLLNLDIGGSLVTAVGEGDLLIGLVGRRKGDLLRLPQKSLCRSARGNGMVYLKDKLPRMVPWDWTGFVSLDLLILYDPDWNLFKPEQLVAIAEWISNGGKLLLILGSHPLPEENPIARMLPFEVQEAKSLQLAGSTLAEWELEGSEPETVTGWPLMAKPDARLHAMETGGADECFFATAYVGFGRVAVMAFDPADMSERQKPRLASFWVNRIATVLEGGLAGSAGATSYSPGDSVRRIRYGAYEIASPYRTIRPALNLEDVSNEGFRSRRYDLGPAQAASNAVMEYLYQEIKPLSIWWVVLLLGTLAVLLGPVDYKLLKHFNRLPLTWLSCAFWIILFTVGAYYGVQAVRGGDMELRVVTVLDGVEGKGPVWSTAYSGLFAPYSADYKFENMQANQWWSGLAPSEQTLYAGRRESAGRRIYCYQQEGSSLPYSVPVNIWTVQCLLTESVVEELPFEAEIERSGRQVTVKITNNADAAIGAGYVLFGEDMGCELGSVPGGASRQFSTAIQRTRPWSDGLAFSSAKFSSRPYGIGQDAFFAQGSLPRTIAMNTYLANGAAVVCVRYNDAPVPFKVKAPSCGYEHILLSRLVVFPKEQKKEDIR
jgi:hypothetical protein